MQPSQLEIQREVEALRDLRRRSTAPGALTLDPDLPNQPSPSSTSTAYWAAATAAADSEASTSSSSSHDTTAESSATSHSGERSPAAGDTPANDPFHLFWVPADVHPEIAPAEFRAFLKEHSRSPPPSGDSAVSRSSSLASSSLGRRRSMLSKQYSPSEDDGVEAENEEPVVPLRRNRSSYHAHPGPNLTINDLQKLERLAEQATDKDDTSELRTMLRRSLSLNVTPTALEGMETLPEMSDEADVPIIVPPPGLILRRAARTKIRKTGLPGDGGGHRFGASRRTRTLSENRTSSDRSSSETGHTDSTDHAPRPQRFSDDNFKSARPDSYSDATDIYDAYAQEYDEPTPIPPEIEEEPISAPQIDLPPSSTSPEPQETQPPVLQHPQPQRMLSPPGGSSEQATSRTPSPAETASSIDHAPSQPQPPPHAAGGSSQQPVAFPTSPPPATRKEKDKKGLFGKWGSDKGSKKTGKEKEKQQRAEKEKEKEKEAGFFGSLFGGKKNKDGDANGSAAGRQSPLGPGRGKSGVPTPSGSPLPPGVNNYSRYPIHVERAIYRLSHIKLANPRRPLYEQVLISNLMFWYLGVINKAQQQQQQQQQAMENAQQNGQPLPAGPDPSSNGAPQDPQQQQQQAREREHQEAAERERLEHERAEQLQREQAEANNSPKKKEPASKRGPLTKPPPSGAGGRRAEMPVKGPQYEQQHRAMEQQYSYGASPQQPSQQQARSGGNGYYNGQPQLQQQQAVPVYYSAGGDDQQQHHHPQQQLPPGAMPPVEPAQNHPPSWGPSPSAGAQQKPRTTPTPQNSLNSSTNNNSSPRRSRSPPQIAMNMNFSSGGQEDWQLGSTNPRGGAKSGRSLSATAVSPSPPPGSSSGGGNRLRKTSNSASASVPSSSHQWKAQSHDGAAGLNARRTADNAAAPAPMARMSEEGEDVPLAVWQQNSRRGK